MHAYEIPPRLRLVLLGRPGRTAIDRVKATVQPTTGVRLVAEDATKTDEGQMTTQTVDPKEATQSEDESDMQTEYQGENKCPECGEPIEDVRVTCHNCGYEYKSEDITNEDAGAEFRAGSAVDESGEEKEGVTGDADEDSDSDDGERPDDEEDSEAESSEAKS